MCGKVDLIDLFFQATGAFLYLHTLLKHNIYLSEYSIISSREFQAQLLTIVLMVERDL